MSLEWKPREIGAAELAGMPRRSAKREDIVPQARPTVADLERQSRRDAALLEFVAFGAAMLVLFWTACL